MGRERRRRRGAMIGWRRESGLGLCQMTLVRSRARATATEMVPRIPSAIMDIPLPPYAKLPVRDGTVEETRAGHRSRGDEESTVSRETSAELHACACVLRLV